MEIIARGQITIWNYKDGDDAYSVILNHDTHAVACDPSGNALGGELGPSGKAVFALSAYKGATKLTMRYSSAASTAGMCAWNFGTISGCTAVQVSGSNEKFYINTMTADSAYVEIVCSVDGKASISKRVTVVKQKKGDTGDPGKPGDDGKQGCMLRPRGTWTAQTQYVYNDQYRDVVIHNNSVYIVKATHTSAVSFDSSKWEPFNEFINVATSVLLANKGYIDVLGAARLFVGDTNKSTGWEMTHGYIKHTKSGLTLTADGKLYDPDGLHLSVGGKTVQAIVDGAVDNIQIGGRNLLLNSGEKIIPNSTSYFVHKYDSSVQFKIGEKYTIVIKGSTSVGQRFGIWINGSIVKVGQFSNNMQGEASYIHVTMPSNIGSPLVSFVNVYNVPDPNGASKPCEIEWIAMYEGHIKPPMDWTPAPEDITTKIEANSSKIEQLPNQITMQVKKDIRIGGRNLARGTSGEWCTAVNLTNSTNQCLAGFTYGVYLGSLSVGDEVTISFDYEWEDFVYGSGWYVNFQGSGNVTGWNGDGRPLTLYMKELISGPNGMVHASYTQTVSAEDLKNEYWAVNIRHDYIRGKARVRNFMAEKGNTPTTWTPAPEDTDAALSSLSSEIKQTADSIGLKVNQVIGGENLIDNSSFSSDLVGWNLVGSGAGMTAQIVNKDKGISWLLGFPCLELWTDGTRKGIWRSIIDKNLMQVDDTFTVGFDLLKRNKVPYKMQVGVEDAGTDATIIDTTNHPLNVWKRIVVTQKVINPSSNKAIIIYGAGGTAGAVYIKNIKVERGSVATSWTPSPTEQNNKLLATGIDIFNKKMIFTADNTVIQDNTGKQIAMFMVKDGKPLLKAENIDVDNLKVKYLDGADGTFKGVLQAASGSFTGELMVNLFRTALFVVPGGNPRIEIRPDVDNCCNYFFHENHTLSRDKYPSKVNVFLPRAAFYDGLEISFFRMVTDATSPYTVEISTLDGVIYFLNPYESDPKFNYLTKAPSALMTANKRVVFKAMDDKWFNVEGNCVPVS